MRKLRGNGLVERRLNELGNNRIQKSVVERRELSIVVNCLVQFSIVKGKDEAFSAVINTCREGYSTLEALS